MRQLVLSPGGDPRDRGRRLAAYDRYDWLRASVDAEPVASVDDVWRRLGSDDGYPRSVCTNMATPENPHGPATCAAIAMNLTTREVWAAGGLIHNVAAERFDWR